MRRVRGLLWGVLFTLVAGLCSCSGIRSSVYMPECVSSTKAVVVAPIAVDRLTLSYCHDAESVALRALVREAETSGAFRMVTPEVLLAHGDGGDSLDTEALLAAAEQLALDAVLFCRVRGHEYTSTTTERSGLKFSYNSSDGLSVSRGEKEVSKTKWSGAEVTLRVVQVPSGDLVAESRFDSNGHQESLGWWNTPPAAEGIVDVIEHTFRPIADAWTR
jgi:hypothetical protein